VSEPLPTEAVCEAALGMVTVLAKGPVPWPMMAKAVGWSSPTLRRASTHLLAAGCITYSRKSGLWSRVAGVALPPSLWPRRLLVEVVERAFAPALDTPAEL
jgi:hypothetical protein